MKIYYLENGALCIELESMEDSIIFRSLHSINNDEQIIFGRSSHNTFVSNPKNRMSVLIDREFMYLCYRESTKLRAIKTVKDVTGWGLKESTEYVDNIWEQIKMGTY